MGVWDEEWGRWWKAFADIAIQRDDLPTLGKCKLTLRSKARPGAYARAVFAAVFSLNKTLRTRFPDVAATTLSGEPFEAETRLRVLLDWYVGDYHFAGGPMARAHFRVAGAPALLAMEAEICWPPMHLVAVTADQCDNWPEAFDLTPWLQHASTSPMAVSLWMPIVRDDALLSGAMSRAAHESKTQREFLQNHGALYRAHRAPEKSPPIPESTDES